MTSQTLTSTQQTLSSDRMVRLPEDEKKKNYIYIRRLFVHACKCRLVDKRSRVLCRNFPARFPRLDSRQNFHYETHTHRLPDKKPMDRKTVRSSVCLSCLVCWGSSLFPVPFSLDFLPNHLILSLVSRGLETQSPGSRVQARQTGGWRRTFQQQDQLERPSATSSGCHVRPRTHTPGLLCLHLFFLVD